MKSIANLSLFSNKQIYYNINCKYLPNASKYIILG